MSVTLQTLDEIRLDVLKEVANIGAGNAMTSLATMLDRTVDMSIPHVGIVSLEEFAQLSGGPEAVSVGVYLPVAGDAPGHVAFLMPHRSACQLADQLLYNPPDTTQELGEMERSALMEVGNILTSSYVVAIGEMTGLDLQSSPPAIAVDMTAAILSTLVSEFAEEEDHALTIGTQILGEYSTLEGYFIYIPEPGSLSTILRALHMEG